MVPESLSQKEGPLTIEGTTKMKNMNSAANSLFWFLIVFAAFAVAFAITLEARADEVGGDDDYATDFCKDAQDSSKSDEDRMAAGILCVVLPCMSRGSCLLEGTLSSPVEGKLARKLKASSAQEWHGDPGYGVTAKMILTPEGVFQAGYVMNFGWKSRELTLGSKIHEGTSFDYSMGFEMALGFGKTVRPEIFVNGFMGFSDFYTPKEDHSNYTQDPNQSWNTPQEPERSDVAGFRGYGVGARLLFGSVIYATGGINRTHYGKVPVLVNRLLTKESQEPVTRYELGAGLKF